MLHADNSISEVKNMLAENSAIWKIMVTVENEENRGNDIFQAKNKQNGLDGVTVTPTSIQR